MSPFISLLLCIRLLFSDLSLSLFFSFSCLHLITVTSFFMFSSFITSAYFFYHFSLSPFLSLALSFFLSLSLSPSLSYTAFLSRSSEFHIWSLLTSHNFLPSFYFIYIFHVYIFLKFLCPSFTRYYTFLAELLNHSFSFAQLITSLSFSFFPFLPFRVVPRPEKVDKKKNT